MLIVGAALKGYAIDATDGKLGTVSDFLFDDRSWKIRWMVVDTGAWLTGRRVLVHPSAIGDVDHHRRQLPVRLTKAQVEGGPDIMSDEPVSKYMESTLYGYYGWNPTWGGGSYFGPDPIMGTPYGMASGYGETGLLDAPPLDVSDDHDPHLQSVAGVTGYHIQATDGAIGHLENFLVDDATWGIRYLIVDTPELVAGPACPAFALRGAQDQLARQRSRGRRVARAGQGQPVLEPGRVDR